MVASTFDEPVTAHVRTAELALERAKRLVEIGRHVVILVDSITRLARAYNLVVNPSGRTLSGGMDPSALYPPKRFFGAARNVCLLYTSDAADERSSVDLGGRRLFKKKNKEKNRRLEEEQKQEK